MMSKREREQEKQPKSRVSKALIRGDITSSNTNITLATQLSYYRTSVSDLRNRASDNLRNTDSRVGLEGKKESSGGDAEKTTFRGALWG